MRRQRIGMFSPATFIVISIIAVSIVPFMVIQPSIGNIQFAEQSILVGALFCAICVLGVVAVFYPTKCRGAFQHVQNHPASASGFPSDVRIEGHHPSCQNFSGNRIVVAGRVYCAACSGLLVGATIAMFGAAFHFFFGLGVVWQSVWLVGLGEVLMLLGLAQIKVAGFVKTILNSLFVVGSYVTLTVVDVTGKNFFVDLYVLGLILFLLWFRIFLSEWNNRRTCRLCQLCFS